MSEAELTAIREAVREEMAPLLTQMEDLRHELQAYGETLGDKTLSLSQVARKAGKSKRTIERRVEEGKLHVIADVKPYRVLFSEYLRATREGDL